MRARQILESFLDYYIIRKEMTEEMASYQPHKSNTIGFFKDPP